MADFKTGDVVKLKSGGPPMTVSGLPAGNSSVLPCSWFDGADVKHSTFMPAALMPCDPIG